jgi:hypothetical protein
MVDINYESQFLIEIIDITEDEEYFELPIKKKGIFLLKKILPTIIIIIIIIIMTYKGMYTRN